MKRAMHIGYKMVKMVLPLYSARVGISINCIWKPSNTIHKINHRYIYIESTELVEQHQKINYIPTFAKNGKRDKATKKI